MNLINLDGYTLENIAQLLVRDPRDVASLRETCRYFAAAIPAELVASTPAHVIIARRIRRAITPEQLAELVIQFPTVWAQCLDIIKYIHAHMSFAHMRVIADFNKSKHSYSNFIYKIYDAVINGELDDATRADIVAYYDKMNFYLTDTCDDIIHEIEMNVALFISSTSDEEKEQMLTDFGHINLYKYNNIDKINALLRIKFLSNHILQFGVNCSHINLTNIDVYYMVKICTDARIIAHLIKLYPNAALYALFKTGPKRRNDLTFWRDIHQYAFTPFTRAHAANYILFAGEINAMIDMNCSVDKSYQKYWRDMFMNRIVNDQGIMKRAIDITTPDEAAKIIMTMGNIYDINDAIKNSWPAIVSRYVPRDVNIFALLQKHNIIKKDEFLSMFVFYTSDDVMIHRNIIVRDYLRAIYNLYPNEICEIKDRLIIQYTDYIEHPECHLAGPYKEHYKKVLQILKCL
jgi:hypothetical protein